MGIRQAGLQQREQARGGEGIGLRGGRPDPRRSEEGLVWWGGAATLPLRDSPRGSEEPRDFGPSSYPRVLAGPGGSAFHGISTPPS